MTEPIFPADDFMRPHSLAKLSGTHWTDFYADEDGFVDALLDAIARHAKGLVTQIEELEKIPSWVDCPPFARRQWYAWEFNSTDRDLVAVPRYNSGFQYNDGSGIQYDAPYQSANAAFPAPAGLASFAYLFDSSDRPKTCLMLGKDVQLDVENGVVTFATDPFLDDRIYQEPLFEGGAVVDYRAYVWLWAVDWDVERLWKQFGYLFGFHDQTSKAYQRALGARLDALVYGPGKIHVRQSLEASTGVRLAQGTELVELIGEERGRHVVVTDQNVYLFARTANLLVAEGDTVTAGQALCDALQIFELNRGQPVPEIRSLVIGKNLWGGSGSVIFENTDTPLIVETVAGRTKVSFALGGFDRTVDEFWDTVHARGLEQGTTLAQYLDVRTDPTGDPTAASLPATINPVSFLIENILRYNFFLGRIRVSALDPTVVKSLDVRAWRQLIPPYTCGLFILELDVRDADITPDVEGTETAPGTSETIEFFDAIGIRDTVSVSGVSERVTFTQVGAACS